MMMPEMDGWLLRQELKKSPELASIPIVILSAHGNVRDAALALGAVDYLRKPLQHREPARDRRALLPPDLPQLTADRASNCR